MMQPWKKIQLNSQFLIILQYKPRFMLASLCCYAVMTISCITFVFYMKYKTVYSVTVSLAVVCLFICAVFSYNFVKKSISMNTSRNLGNDRLSSVMQDIHSADIEHIMIKTIAWYSTKLKIFRHSRHLTQICLWQSHFSIFI